MPLQAPWTEQQVTALNAYQRSGRFHAFTCGSNKADEAHRVYAEQHGQDQGQLVATPDGWHCPVCDYKQTWAHEFMAQPLPPDPFAHLAQGGEARRAETGTGSVHEHPVAAGEAPANNTMSMLTAHPGSDDAVSEIPTLKAEIERLSIALAESERKRVEELAALTALYAWYDRDGSVGGASDVFAEHRHLIAPTQQTGEGQR